MPPATRSEPGGRLFPFPASMKRRPLSGDEVREAEKVFGDSLDFEAVRVVESAVMGVGNYARTPFETVYFPPGAGDSAAFVPWLIHELTHVWQTQHGVSVLTKLRGAVRGRYDYGGEAGLRAGRRFRDFNTEQQGDICRDYYRTVVAGGDTSAYERFLAEVRAARATPPRPPRPRRRPSGAGRRAATRA